ncbi:ATP-binding cassette domain-containing protein [Plantactinospora endophytica]|uniref:ABC transporter domain-containing protein n=1 Tax=Plantactinospora endophytica TaxID=673535 RepID=A0ABQ4E4U4_9ACTN|nr:ATP-binding cassette domain-containing protein [Plantactinospora endophytica]GIG89703.1 hypothetical protein Pen02_46390 [Plantactinospora endophytica]
MRLDQVWLRYGARAPWVLRAVEVEIGPGQSAVVLGRNGVGKSTLLQLAVGVLSPTRGVVRDRPRTVGWVPERFPADQPYTVEQYLTGMARVRGLSGAAVARTVGSWVERLGLAAYRDVRMPALSKGTAQKVGLAQALLRPPGLLVLDEPWEGLDAATREVVPELIGEVLDDGGAVLVSDHRGETVRLPYAAQWTVADGTVSVVRPAADGTRASGSGTTVVEISVPTARALETVAALRAAGHQILRVRPAEPPPTGHVDHPADPPDRVPDDGAAPVGPVDGGDDRLADRAGATGEAS